MTTTILVQYFDGCPNWKQADEELQEAIGDPGLGTEIIYEKIESPERAEEVGFRGRGSTSLPGRPVADRVNVFGDRLRSLQRLWDVGEIAPHVGQQGFDIPWSARSRGRELLLG